MSRFRIPPTLFALAALLGVTPAASAGDGRFTGGPDLPVTGPTAVATGDFNNDGRADVAAIGRGDRRVIVFVQTATGELNPAPSVDAGSDPQTLAVGDFNRDGNDDLAVGDVGTNKVRVFLGDAKAAFEPKSEVDLPGAPVSLAVTDLESDGRDDLAAAASDGGRAVVVTARGEGDGRFGAPRKGSEGPATLVVADFNGDSFEDLAYGGARGYLGAAVATGKGDGGLNAPTEIKLPQPSTRDGRGWATGDFNADGKVDIVTALGRDLTAVRLGGGDGTFAAGSDVLTRGAPAAVAVADFNSDGNEDFAVTDASGTKTVRIRLGDGKGGFSAAPDVAVGNKPVDIAVADFTGDAVDDLAVANNADNTVSIRPGTGRATLDGNLLVNGSFEGRTPTGKLVPPPSIPGWDISGGAAYQRYGWASHAYVPASVAAPRYAGAGTRMLTGGFSTPTGGVTTASQTVDVAGRAAAIDDGRVTANLSAYLGGALQFEDSMRARAELLNAAGARVGQLEIGPVTVTDRAKQTTMLRRAGRQAVPASTRRIRVTFISNDADKTISSATADNAKLTLDTAAPGAGPLDRQPPRGNPATFGRSTLVTLTPATRKLRSTRKPLKVRVRNRNGFGVTGRLRGGARSRMVRVSGRSTQTLTVRLSKRQRRALQRKRSLSIRLSAVIRDPAGTTRRVSRRVRVGLRSK